MSKYIALTSFSGAISMYKGEERELKSKNIIEDLLRAGYIEETTNEEVNEVVESEDK